MCKFIKRLFSKKKPSFVAFDTKTFDSYEIQVFIEELNIYRMSHGLPKLIANDHLHQIAKFRVDFLALTGEKITHAHFTDDVLKPLLLLGFSWAGENLSQGYHNLESTYRAWKRSAEHNSNLLSRSWTRVGLYHKSKIVCLIFAK